MSWGNAGNTTENQDMISGVGDHRILKVNDVNNGNDAKIAAYFINNSNNAAARALKVDGKTEMNNDVYLNGSLFIDVAESGIYSKDHDPIFIGTTAASGEVDIGNDDHGVQLFGNVGVGGHLAVGPFAAAANIDAHGNPNGQNLAIGAGNGTANVSLGRANQTIDMFCQTRLNNNGLVINDAASVIDALGFGIKYNSVGHGNNASIDFYVFGVVRAYIDQTGVH